MSKEQLTEIRELIRQKRYAQARQRLTDLSDSGNPTARKWLQKLDEIAPVAAPTPARRKPAPASKQSSSSASKFDYSADRIKEIAQEKEEKRAAEQQEKTNRRTLGCLLRGCFSTVLIGGFLFLMAPMFLAAGLTSGNQQTQQMTSSVFTFVEEQQENPVGRTVTNVYTQTSGRAMKQVVESRGDDICDVAIQQAANNGRIVSRAECQVVLEEATACVTDEFAEAQRCLRDYTFNRCVEQAGNSSAGRAFCNDFVDDRT
ncbi:MAG: hypothetical protein AAFR22_15845 [Chloroflexota bacterium]